MKFKNYLDEAIVLKQDTADKINNISKDPALKKIARKIVMFKKNDEGWGMARVMSVNLMNDFMLAMGSAYEKGKKFDVDKEFNKKKFQKVTDPFESWIKEYAKGVHKHLYGK